MFSTVPPNTSREPLKSTLAALMSMSSLAKSNVGSVAPASNVHVNPEPVPHVIAEVLAVTISANQKVTFEQDILPKGDIDFQQAAEILTTAGNLTLNPAGNVSSTATIGPSVNSSFDLGVQTNGQWANLWADLVNGADYAYVNGWRTLESEKYDGYPKGIAFANTCFTDGIVTETMPQGCNPVFVVTEDFVEFNGQRFYSQMPPLLQPTPAPGSVSNALAAMLLIGLLAALGVVVLQYHSRAPRAPLKPLAQP